MQEAEIRLVVPPGREMIDLLGQGDHLLKLIEDQFEADIRVRGNEITISGDPQEAQAVSALFTEMLQLVDAGSPLTPESLDRAGILVQKVVLASVSRASRSSARWVIGRAASA